MNGVRASGWVSFRTSRSARGRCRRCWLTVGRVAVTRRRRLFGRENSELFQPRGFIVPRRLKWHQRRSRFARLEKHARAFSPVQNSRRDRSTAREIGPKRGTRECRRGAKKRPTKITDTDDPAAGVDEHDARRCWSLGSQPCLYVHMGWNLLEIAIWPSSAED